MLSKRSLKTGIIGRDTFFFLFSLLFNPSDPIFLCCFSLLSSSAAAFITCTTSTSFNIIKSTPPHPPPPISIYRTLTAWTLFGRYFSITTTTTTTIIILYTCIKTTMFVGFLKCVIFLQGKSLLACNKKLPRALVCVKRAWIFKQKK